MRERQRERERDRHRLYFVQVTSTICYRQNNGKLERAVQTINNSTDLYNALLAQQGLIVTARQQNC